MKVGFLQAAEHDLVEAATHYEAQRAGLGADFAAEVERVANVLCEHPSLGEKLDRVHRRISLRRFPYALIYSVEAELIRVITIAHLRRRPRFWAPRVQEA